MSPPSVEHLLATIWATYVNAHLKEGTPPVKAEDLFPSGKTEEELAAERDEEIRVRMLGRE